MDSHKYQLSPDLLFVDHQGKHLVYQSARNSGLVLSSELCSALKSRDLERVLALADADALADLLSEGILYTDPDAYAEHAQTGQDPSHEELVTPRIAYIQVTRACNLRCSYCYNRENLRQSDRTPSATLLKMFSLLRENGVETLIFTGGEPTVRRDFEELVRQADGMGFRLQLLTNGTGLLRRHASLPVFSSIIASVDTLRPEHSLRCGLDLPRLTEDLRALPAEIRRKTTLRAVVGRSYPDDWREVKAFADAHGFSFMTTVMMPSCPADLDQLPTLENLNMIPEPFRQAIGCNSCGAGRGILALDGEGWIYPCQALIREPLRLANLFHEDWKTALIAARRRLRLWERTVDRIEPCSRCSVRYLCGGGCMAVSYDVYKDLFATVREICAFRKAEALGKLQGILEAVGAEV